MSPQNTTSPENSELSSLPEMLSDEEIRSRAAAYAQRIYEQQLEAYEAQRAQVMEMRRLQEEYMRQQAAYEEACRAYYAQHQVQPAVRIDAETGEQVYASYQAESNELPSAEESYAEPELMPDEVNAFAEVVPESDGNSEEDIEVSEEENPPAEDFFDPETANPADSVNSDVPAPKLAATVAPRFPLISVLLVIFCVAALSAEGYILFSDDPRFERQRNNFFSAIGWDNAVREGEDVEKKAQKKLELPELRRKIEPTAVPDPEPVSEPVPTEEPVPDPQEIADEIVSEDAVPADAEDDIFSDEEAFSDEEEY